MEGDLTDRANQFFEAGDFDGAMQLFSELAKVAPNSDERAAALIGQGKCLEVLGRFAEARDCLREVRNLEGQDDPEYVAWLDYLEAGIDAREGRDKESLRRLDGLLENFAAFLKTPQWIDLYERVQILRSARLQNLKRPREALPLFVEALGFTAEKPKDHNYRMAYCLAECGDVSRAKDAVTNALKGKLDRHEEWTARYYLGAIYAAGNEYESALAEFQFCECHLDDSDGSITNLMDSLAYVCSKLGRLDDAARYGRASQTSEESQDRS